MPKTEFDYYYGVEAEQFTFVRVPKVLFTDKEHFGGLSNEANLLYGLLLERMSLSRKNNWIDKHNRVYIIFPVEEIEEILDVGHEKALNLLKELDNQSEIGLVKKKRRGLGLPSILYVKNFIVKGEQNTDRVPTSRSTENEFQEFGKTDFKKSENQTSENPKNRLLEVRKSDSNQQWLQYIQRIHLITLKLYHRISIKVIKAVNSSPEKLLTFYQILKCTMR